MLHNTNNPHQDDLIEGGVQDGATATPSPALDLEPLVSYLTPRFGNVYELDEVPDEQGDYHQPWAPELRTAVTEYLTQEADDEVFAEFLAEFDYEIPDGSREARAEAIVEAAEPWEVAHTFHRVAVRAIPTLAQLIGERDTWPNADLKEDVGTWLDAHASRVQLLLLAKLTNYRERSGDTPWYQPEPTGWDFTQGLTPREMLDAWDEVAGSAESDLTDAEWELLVPLLPARRYKNATFRWSAETLAKRRRVYDGIWYKIAHGVGWGDVPQRYGAPGTIYHRMHTDERAGTFAHMRQVLQDNPAAERVVAWLEEVA
jgi:transposase